MRCTAYLYSFIHLLFPGLFRANPKNADTKKAAVLVMKTAAFDKLHQSGWHRGSTAGRSVTDRMPTAPLFQSREQTNTL